MFEPAQMKNKCLRCGCTFDSILVYGKWCRSCLPHGLADENATLRATRVELFTRIYELENILREILGTTMPCCCGRDHIVEKCIGDRAIVRRAQKVLGDKEK